MTEDDIKYKAASEVSKLGLKAFDKGQHRDVNKPPPKGKDWLPGKDGVDGVFYKAEKMEEAIAFLKIADGIRKNALFVYHIAYAYEVMGRYAEAISYYEELKGLETYDRAKQGIERCKERMKM